MRQVTASVRHFGSTRQYQDCTSYKFGRDVRTLEALSAAGWRVVRENTGYAYLAPPAGVSYRGKSVAVTLAIPDFDQVDALAALCHANGQAWHGELDGWPAHYKPAEHGQRRITVLTLDGLAHPDVVDAARAAYFGIGGDIWNVVIRWDTGDDSAPTVRERLGYARSG